MARGSFAARRLRANGISFARPCSRISSSVRPIGSRESEALCCSPRGRALSASRRRTAYNTAPSSICSSAIPRMMAQSATIAPRYCRVGALPIASRVGFTTGSRSSSPSSGFGHTVSAASRALREACADQPGEPAPKPAPPVMMTTAPWPPCFTGSGTTVSSGGGAGVVGASSAGAFDVMATVLFALPVVVDSVTEIGVSTSVVVVAPGIAVVVGCCETVAVVDSDVKRAVAEVVVVVEVAVALAASVVVEVVDVRGSSDEATRVVSSI